MYAERRDFINLENTSSADCLDRLSEVPIHFIGHDQPEIQEFYISHIANGQFQVNGIMPGNTTHLNLKFGYGNELAFTVPLTVTKTENISKAEYLWTLEKIRHLSANYIFNKDEITELGKKYSIITQNTSLIILDEVSDYATHRITPPAELLEQYNQLILEEDKRNVSDKKEHKNYVLNLLQERKTWWNSSFDKIIKKPVAPGLMSERIMPMAAPMGNSEISASRISTDGYGGESRRMRETEESSDMDMVDAGGASAKKSLSAQDTPEPYDNSSIEIKKFESSETYSDAMRSWNGDLYLQYLEMRAQYKSAPTFYIDAAQILFEKGLKKEAYRILSNLAEMELENHELMRAYAYKLKEWKDYAAAVPVFYELTKMREEEPQSFRDLGLIYYLSGDNHKAVLNLYKVVTTRWDTRFPEIEMIALVELNNIIATAEVNFDYTFVDKDFIYHMPCDIRIIIEWNYDNSDIDLWVTDPYDEKCMYNHTRTEIGGRISRDFTGGYGPEEFLLKKAIPGKYKVEANYYGNSREKVTGPATIFGKTHYTFRDYA